VVFLISAGIKAIAPQNFWRHVSGLRIIPDALAGSAVTGIAGLEGALGVALLIGLWPEILLPATAALLAALTAVTWWSVRVGRASDCGCYGGVIRPSVPQSTALNGIFVVLLLAAWRTFDGSPAIVGWRVVAVTLAGVLVALFTAFVQGYNRATGRELVDFSPMRIGRRWRPEWAGDGQLLNAGENLVSFLGPQCPHCMQWVRVLNVIHSATELPPVVGIIGASKEDLDTFIEASGIRFPTRIIPNESMARLVNAVPTTVLVESGVIRDIWSGAMSESFLDRFKRAFFPGSTARTVTEI